MNGPKLFCVRAELVSALRSIRSLRFFSALSTVFVMLCLLCISTAPVAASSTSYAIDPRAHKILDQMQSAYTALHSLSEQVTGEESPGLSHSIAVHTSLHMLRPGYVSMISDSKSSRSGSSAVVADGSHCYVTAPQYPARYARVFERIEEGRRSAKWR